jgi:hypothetical protein
VNVNEDAANTVINLRASFDDAEDTAAGLSYSIVDNSDPRLFTSVSINPATGELTLDYAPDAFGFAVLTVRAVDSGGLSVETTLAVNIKAINDAPILSGLRVVGTSVGTWIISGGVSDVDDEVAGWAIYFGGVLASYSISASTDEDGSFSIEVELPGLQSGDATAWTFDPHGLQSNVAVAVVTV